MAISFIASSNVSAYDLDGTFVVNKPTNTAQGDVMFTMVNTFNGTPPSVPSGWTLVTNRNNATPSLGTYIYRKVAGASEPSTYSWGLDPGLDLAANISVHTYRGVDTTTPVGNTISAVSTTAESLASGNVSVTTPGSWLLAVSGCRHSGTSGCTCTTASMSERVDVTAADTAGSFSRSMASYDSNGEVATGNQTRTAVVTGTTLAHTVILIVIQPDLDAASTLTDNFDDNSIDTNKWTNGGGSFTAGATEAGGQLRITDVVGGASAKGIGSKVPYDLRGSSVQVQIASVFTDTTSIFYPIRISRTSASDGTNWAAIDVFNGNIRVVTSDDSVVYTTAYSPTNHKFVRIREASNTVFFDRSPDGVNWTNMTSQTTAALAFAVDEVWLSVQHFNGAAIGSSSTAAIDNFNIVPVLNTLNRTDDEALSDSHTVVLDRERSASDAEDLSDSLTAEVGYNRSASDGEDLSDNLTASQGFGRSAEDAEDLSDSLTASLGYGVSADDTETLTDSLTASLGIAESASDDVALSDSASVVQEFNRSASDGLDLSDAISTELDYNRSASDGVDLSDDLSRVAEYQRGATDVLSLADTASAALDVVRDQEDVEGLSDSLTAVLEMARDASDDTGLTDSVSIAVARVAEFSDDESLSDEVQADTGTVVNRSDLLDLSDSVTRVAEYRRDLEDTLGLADSLSAALDAVLSTDDTLSLSDDVTAALSLPLSATDEVSLSDSVTISIARNLEVSDSLALSDQTAIDVEFAEIVSDLEDLSDSTSWHLSLTVSDALGLSDSADTDGGNRVLEKSDVLTLSDSLTVGLYRTTFEPLERRAVIGTTERVSRTEDIERKWSIGNGS